MDDNCGDGGQGTSVHSQSKSRNSDGDGQDDSVTHSDSVDDRDDDCPNGDVDVGGGYDNNVDDSQNCDTFVGGSGVAEAEIVPSEIDQFTESEKHDNMDILFPRKGTDRHLQVKLYDALVLNDTNAVNEILESGQDPDVDFDFTTGEDPELWVAAKELDEGQSPLHLACSEGQVDMVELLVKFGADVNRNNAKWETALHVACKTAHIDCVRKLIQFGADVNHGHDLIDGDSPLLTTVACYQTFSPLADVYLEITRVLLQAKCEVDRADAMGLAPIHIAVTKDDTRMSQLLVEAGSDINLQGRYVMTPLMRAVEQAMSANVLFLLQQKCDINARSASGHTALSLAVEKGRLDILMDILSAKPSLYASASDFCPFQYAASHKQVVVLLLLISYGGIVNTINFRDKVSILLTLARRDSYEGVKMLLRLGANPNMESRFGTTPLWAAVKNNNLNIARLLLEWNADPEIVSIEMLPLNALRPITLSLHLGHWELTFTLLSIGAYLSRGTLAPCNIPRKVQRHQHIHDALIYYCTNPRSLQVLCRVKIRRCLAMHIHKKLARLNYPVRLKDYILTKIL